MWSIKTSENNTPQSLINLIITGVTKFNLLVNQETVSISKPWDTWQELSNQDGIQQVHIEVSGTILDSYWQQRLLERSLAQQLNWYQIYDNERLYVSGKFLIASLMYESEYDQFGRYHMVLKSSGAINLTQT